MLRSTAHLLVVVMLFASGRLLACGWECLDELASPAAASCHQESVPATALNGDNPHACLPEVAEARVTVAKLATAPVVMVLVIADRSRDALPRYRQARHLRFESPPAPAPSVLRI